jgi:hypothetical protein
MTGKAKAARLLPGDDRRNDDGPQFLDWHPDSAGRDLPYHLAGMDLAADEYGDRDHPAVVYQPVASWNACGILARLIAGKSVQQAQRLLIGQPGVGMAAVQLSGDTGQTLPAAPSKITIVVQATSGA